MTRWPVNFLGSVANFALIFTTIKVLIDLLASWLGEHHHQRLLLFFERRQADLDQCSPDKLHTVPLLALTRTYERVLGPKPFSRQAFLRTCIFGALFLGASLGFTGLLCDKPFAMNMPPWKSFLASTEYLRILAAQPSIHQQMADSFHIDQNAADLASLGSWPFALGFTAYFVVVVVVSTGFLVSVSVALSRLFLQEMISANTLFRVFLLFLSNTVLLFALGAGASLILFVLLNVWTWPFLPLLFALSTTSFPVGAGLAYAGSLCSWFFAAPWLRVVVVIALLPSILLAFVIGMAMLGFPLRRRFLAAATYVVQRGLRSPKGLFSFLSSSSAALALILLALASFSAWLARLSLSLSTPTLLGVNSLVVAFTVLLIMFILSLARAKNNCFPGDASLGFQNVVFIFFGTLCVIIFGFYIEIIIGCFVNVESTVLTDHRFTVALPAVSAILPGSIAAYCVVASRLANTNWIKATVRIFFVLTVFDLCAGLRGLATYHDCCVSVLCNLLGAPIVALVIFKSHDFLFRPVSSAASVHYMVKEERKESE